MKYTIAAHRTKYNGVEFRSRLEARWAAFFDLLNWSWEYEPLDLDGWTPDFRLGGQVLVEVKPFSKWSEWTRDIVEKVVPGTILCGDSPLHNLAEVHEDHSGNEALISHAQSGCKECAEFLAKGGWVPIRVLRDPEDPWGKDREQVEQLWREAGNRVQWRPQ